MEKAVEEAQADIDKIQETLHNAEALVEQKDKEIADLQKRFDETNDTLKAAQDTIAERDKVIEGHVAAITGKDAEIENLRKQVADLTAEVKELAGRPAPMTDEKGGVPESNATGDAPRKHKRITRDMSYEEIRAAKKAERKASGK
jgi:chromosome segregation ATPase